MIRSRRANYGGNRANQSGGKPAFPNKPSVIPSATKLITSAGPIDAEKVPCPTCGRLIARRKSDGGITRHRVGRSAGQSYPCPGDDKGTP